METKEKTDKYLLISYSDWEIVLTLILVALKVALFYILFVYIVYP